MNLQLCKKLSKLPMASLILLSIFFVSPANAGEAAKPVFDGRQWELGWSQNKNAAGTGQLVFDEYVLKGETVENWSELVTIQFFPGLNQQTNLDVFEGSLKNNIMNVCPAAVWDSFEQQKNERYWQFTVTNCKGQPNQSELVRAVKTNEGIHLFHYAIKKAPMPEDVRKTWLSNLKSMKID